MSNFYFLAPTFRVVSGGQTGAELAALDWAIGNEAAYGGWCPRDRRSAAGRIPDHYLLTETPSDDDAQHIQWNVRDSDATVVFTPGDVLGGTSGHAVRLAQELQRPCLHFHPGLRPGDLSRFLALHQVEVLNITGSSSHSSTTKIIEISLITTSID